MDSSYNAKADMLGFYAIVAVAAILWVVFYVQPRDAAIREIIECMPDRSVEAYDQCAKDYHASR